jgi:hypothetical protein
MAQMARVKHALAEATGDAQADRYLTQLTIHHATGVGIDATGPAAQERFEPTLFGNTPTLAGFGDNEDQAVQRERLLGDEQAHKFQHTLFTNQGARSHYRLSEGIYAVLDPPVEAALRVLQRVNASSPATRAAFRADPRSFLTEEIEKAGGAGDILCGGTLLQEVSAEDAHEYGDRVLGVGERDVKPPAYKDGQSRGWFGDEEAEPHIIRVPGSEQPLVVRPDEIADLRAAVEAARSAGEPEVMFKDRSVPVSDTLAEQLRSFCPEPGPASTGKQEKPEQETGPLVLKVAENESALTYNAKLRDPDGRFATSQDLRLRSTLKPHQTEGLTWLKSAWLSGMPGVLLADDMGLGKTIQVLAFLAWLRAQPDPEPRPVP